MRNRISIHGEDLTEVFRDQVYQNRYMLRTYRGGMVMDLIVSIVSAEIHGREEVIFTPNLRHVALSTPWSCGYPPLQGNWKRINKVRVAGAHLLLGKLYVEIPQIEGLVEEALEVVHRSTDSFQADFYEVSGMEADGLMQPIVQKVANWQVTDYWVKWGSDSTIDSTICSKMGLDKEREELDGTSPLYTKERLKDFGASHLVNNRPSND